MHHTRDGNRVFAISKVISLKVNVLIRLKFELAYFEAAVPSL